MYLVFQLTFLSLLLVCLFAFLTQSERRNYLVLLGIAWVASIGSLVVQITSPGVDRRAAMIAENAAMPIPSLVQDSSALRLIRRFKIWRGLTYMLDSCCSWRWV